MQDMREIPAIVTEKIVIKCRNFHSFGGGTSLVMAVAKNNFSSSIDKVSFKKISMSLGLVVLEKKLFTWTRKCTYTPQSDDIKMMNISPPSL